MGEFVEAEIMEEKRRFARARFVRVVQPSAERVEHACRYFGDCGGCQYQHLDYYSQLRLKQKQIGDLFERIGGFVPPLVAAGGAFPPTYRYLNLKLLLRPKGQFKQSVDNWVIYRDKRAG